MLRAVHPRQRVSRILEYYHYTQEPRLTIIANGVIFWRALFIWYTPDRYETVRDAQEFLALPRQPTHRIGPVSEDQLPLLAVALRKVAPNFGRLGGGWEVAVMGPVYLLRIQQLQ